MRWICFFLMTACLAGTAAGWPAPPGIWNQYDPDAGDFREEVVREETVGGVHYRDTYISAYVNGEEIRVYCQYAVRAGTVKAPGLMDVHGWYGRPNVNRSYVDEGWAVMAHDYAGKFPGRDHYTKYPESLRHGNMNPDAGGGAIWAALKDGSSITDPTQTSDYLWYAIQRRVLSYLLSRGEVDPDRIGAMGFSYGGTIMWNLAMDARVKAVVAYFGIGWNVYYRDRAVWKYNLPYVEPTKTPGHELYLSALAPQAHAPFITAASLWLNGSNDHHGGHERGGDTFRMFQPGVPWDFAVQARGHHNTEKLGDDTRLWLEKHVLGRDIFWPARPVTKIILDEAGVPELRITPTSPERVTELKAYYALKEANNLARAWRDAATVREGDTWVAAMPVMNVEDYVFAYANIQYDNLVQSTDFNAAIPSQLGPAVATDKPSPEISDYSQWSDIGPAEGLGGITGFRPLNRHRGTSTKQFNDPKWRAPSGARLSFRFYCTQPQPLTLVVNDWYEMPLGITASDAWQTMEIPAGRLLHRGTGQPLADWSEVKSMTIKPEAGADITMVIFADFRWVTEATEEAAGRGDVSAMVRAPDPEPGFQLR